MRNRLHELVPASAPVPHTEIIIEPSLADKTAELLQRVHLLDKRLLLVCDANTHTALGARLLHESSSHITPLILPATPHADETMLALVRSHGAKAEGYLAAGSGTVNDLCKYASFQDQKPYAVFPTAPSMNGYLSANASITTGEHKKSLPAHLPAGVFCDLEVISAAPMRLIRSGLGDSVCRSTAQADWLFSHLVLGTPYDALPFSFLEPYEEDLLNAASALAERKRYAIELLLRTLLASGLGMVVARGSYPASQGEHLLAHTMEMKHGHNLPATYHGEQIGVTTLVMAALQERILSHPIRLRRHNDWLATALAYFGETQREEIVHAGKAKFDAIALRIEEINDLFTTEKNRIRDAITHITRPAAQIEKALQQAGAPTTPEALGWSAEQLDSALHHACYMRDRFTFLDLV